MKTWGDLPARQPKWYALEGKLKAGWEALIIGTKKADIESRREEIKEKEGEHSKYRVRRIESPW